MNAQITKSVVSAMTATIFRAKEDQGQYVEPTTCAIMALAVFRMMDALVRDESVPMLSMVELAAQSIAKANSYNNDLKQYHFTDEPIKLIGLAKHMGYLVAAEEGCKMSDAWVELVTVKDQARPFVAKFSKEQRRKPYIKGGKVKPSKLMKEAIEFLEDTSYHVDTSMVAIIKEVITRNAGNLPDVIKQEEHVWHACVEMVAEQELYSENFADNRGRLYHVACAGPNPQSSDFSRAMYSHNVENPVSKLDTDGSLTESYRMFMAELEDISGGKWCESKMLTRVAQNPAGALHHMLSTGDAPKKPFTYIRLALDWFKFETTGVCDSRVGFGLDAKCSGTQYLAFIAGNMQMARATGLVDSDDKSADPYQLSLVELMKLLARSSMNPVAAIVDEFLNPKAGRNFVKTPYMAVQYGGGVTALVENSDFVEYVTNNLRIEKLQAFAELCVEAVHLALGSKINKFIEKTQEAVHAKCFAEGKDYFTYKHTDGQVVHKPCFPDREICAPFSIRVDPQTRVIFGNMKEGTGWKIRASKPTAEEFVRTFVVNFIQGIDALVARTVAKYAKKAGLRAYTSIHDCFRTCLADAPKMMAVIREAYIEIFVKNNQFESLSKQVGGIMMAHENIVTEELLNSPYAYYFCQ